MISLLSSLLLLFCYESGSPVRSFNIIDSMGVNIKRTTTKYENFVLTVVDFDQHYRDGLSLGIASIISPIAILISISAVIKRKNRVAEEIRIEIEEKGLI